MEVPTRPSLLETNQAITITTKCKVYVFRNLWCKSNCEHYSETISFKTFNILLKTCFLVLAEIRIFNHFAWFQNEYLELICSVVSTLALGSKHSLQNFCKTFVMKNQIFSQTPKPLN